MLPSAPAHAPRQGASIIYPRELQTLVSAGTTSPLIRFRFPFRTFVRALMMSTDVGTKVALANLSLELQDGHERILTSDGQGFKLNVPGGALMGGIGVTSGLGVGGWGRPWAMQRLIQAGELWSAKITNANAFDVTPEIAFVLGEPK